MKLATWNLWWKYGDPDAREPAILETLENLDADVVGLQEVWHDDENNLASRLADKLGYQVAFAPSPNPGKWQRRAGSSQFGIGNAVLSRWPIETLGITRLSPGNALDEGRVALHTLVKTPHGGLPFTSTHLNSGWGQSTIRSNQLREIGQFITDNQTTGLPPVVVGDFNTPEDSDEVRAFSAKSEPLAPSLVLLDAWYFVHPTVAGFTWDRTNPHVDATNEPSSRIDYIFSGIASSDGLGKPIDAGLFGNSPIDGVWPSDHYGVWVDTRHS